MNDETRAHRTPNGIMVMWPEGVPRNDRELVRDYGLYIEKRIERYNKVERHLDDLRQHIWEKLIKGRFLEKFVAALASKAMTMTVEQAIGYLGISRGQWSTMVLDRQDNCDELGWLPGPVKLSSDGQWIEDTEVDPYALTTVVSVNDIVLVDECGYFRVQKTDRAYIKLNKKGFKSYLQRAIKNHWANWCRTHSRRYKEQLLAPNTALSPNTDGSFHQASRLEDFTSWETTLVAASFDDEALLDTIAFADKLREVFEKNDLNLADIHEVEQYVDAEGRKRERPTPAARKGLEILDFVTQGYTIQEAITAQARSESRHRSRQRQAATA